MTAQAAAAKSDIVIQQGLVHQVLTFFYTLAHQIGVGAGKLFQTIFVTRLPENLVDPIGFLVIITLFLILISLAKKIAVWVVIVGWVLMAVRLLMVIFKA